MTNLGTLNERLQSKLQQDRAEIEAQAKAELQNLSDSLNAQLQNVLHTTAAAMSNKSSDLIQSYSNMTDRLHNETLRLQKTLLRALVRNILIGGSIALGLALGAWGISNHFSKRLVALQGSISNLEKYKSLLQNTISQLEDSTSGIVLMDTKDGKFLVLPEGISLKSGWTIGKLPAWKME